jgi:hypothetical protein
VVRDKAQAAQALQQYLLTQGIASASIREIKPSMEDVFVALAEGGMKQWNLQ